MSVSLYTPTFECVLVVILFIVTKFKTVRVKLTCTATVPTLSPTLPNIYLFFPSSYSLFLRQRAHKNPNFVLSLFPLSAPFPLSLSTISTSKASSMGTTEAGEGTSYEGGVGAGGKFRKRPFRKPQATPYDRPPTALRNRRTDGWLSKIVDPASKLISATAHLFFSSLSRKRLPPAPPRPPPGSIHSYL